MVENFNWVFFFGIKVNNFIMFNVFYLMIMVVIIFFGDIIYFLVGNFLVISVFFDNFFWSIY